MTISYILIIFAGIAFQTLAAIVPLASADIDQSLVGPSFSGPTHPSNQTIWFTCAIKMHVLVWPPC